MAAVCALLGLLLTRAASGTDPLYQNDGFVDYEGVQGTYPPAIDATNFVNNSTFNINWNFIIGTTASPNNYLYETANTVNYTNNRLMSSDIGFVFDTRTDNGFRVRWQAVSIIRARCIVPTDSSLGRPTS